MKQLYLFASAALLSGSAIAQSVGVGTTTPNASAALEVQSTSKGLLLPRLTQTQMEGILDPEPGLLIYNTTANAFYGYRTVSRAANLQQNSGSTSMVLSTAYGQSFTAPANGTLDALSIVVRVPASGSYFFTVDVYAGDGSSGTLLGSANRALLSSSGLQTGTFSLSSFNVALRQGQQYTIYLRPIASPSGWLDIFMNSNDPYAGGRLYGLTIPSGTYDINFKIDYTQTGEWSSLN